MKHVKYPLDTKKSCDDFRTYCHELLLKRWGEIIHIFSPAATRDNEEVTDYTETLLPAVRAKTFYGHGRYLVE